MSKKYDIIVLIRVFLIISSSSIASGKLEATTLKGNALVTMAERGGYPARDTRVTSRERTVHNVKFSGELRAVLSPFMKMTSPQETVAPSNMPLMRQWQRILNRRTLYSAQQRSDVTQKVANSVADRALQDPSITWGTDHPALTMTRGPVLAGLDAACASGIIRKADKTGCASAFKPVLMAAIFPVLSVKHDNATGDSGRLPSSLNLFRVLRSAIASNASLFIRASAPLTKRLGVDSARSVEAEWKRSIIVTEENVLKDVCVLIGKDREGDAKTLINGMILPGEKGKPVKIDDAQFAEIKTYYSHYGVLINQTCGHYAVRLIRELNRAE